MTMLTCDSVANDYVDTYYYQHCIFKRNKKNTKTVFPVTLSPHNRTKNCWLFLLPEIAFVKKNLNFFKVESRQPDSKLCHG